MKFKVADMLTKYSADCSSAQKFTVMFHHLLKNQLGTELVARQL